MDKLTTEQKAERYVQALDRAKKWYNAPNIDKMPTYGNRIIEEIFPELIEPEDEKIRKSLINVFSTHKDYEMFFGVSVKDILAWLEKQKDCEHIKKDWFEHLKQSWYKEGFIDGKYSGGTSKEWTINDTTTLKELIDFLENGTAKLQHDLTQYAKWLKIQFAPNEKQGEQKSDNKFETKFKVGDWVVVDGITQKVTHIQTDGFDTDRAWNGKSTFNDVHLWTIADVKDCDVLVDVYGNVGIYKSHDDFSWLSYCSLGYYGGFQHFTIEHDNEKTYPATKEQRERFFAAMHDAGYEWDAEKKELKKISQRMISAEAKEAMYGKPTAWSEEDEKMVNNILTPLAGSFPWNIYQPMYDWLKALKGRVGCEANFTTMWKPSEKQIMCLQDALSDYHRRGYKAETLETLLKQLKQL